MVPSSCVNCLGAATLRQYPDGKRIRKDWDGETPAFSKPHKRLLWKQLPSTCNSASVAQGPCLWRSHLLDSVTPTLNLQPISHLYWFGWTLGLSGNWRTVSSVNSSSVSLLGILLEVSALIYLLLGHSQSLFSSSVTQTPLFPSLAHSLSTAIPIYVKISEGTTIFTYIRDLRLFWWSGIFAREILALISFLFREASVMEGGIITQLCFPTCYYCEIFKPYFQLQLPVVCRKTV